MDRGVIEALWKNLDSRGFDCKKRKRKTEKVKALSAVLTAACIGPFLKSATVVGSLADTTSLGVGNMSDIDVLMELKNAVVTSKRHEVDIPAGFHMFLVNYVNACPGYCFLAPLHDGWLNAMLSGEELYARGPDNIVYLSSSFVSSRVKELYSLSNVYGIEYDIHGPAITPYVRGKGIYDIVPAIKCRSWPPMMSDWRRRRRQFWWPPEELLDECMASQCYVVPVGSPNSELQCLEWRLSFNEPERKLVESFDSVLYKIFILIKFLFKLVIIPQMDCLDGALTSYCIKIAYFWILESKSRDFWRIRNLKTILSEYFELLQSYIINDFLPNYFVTGSNIFKRNFTTIEKEKILPVISRVQQDGLELIRGCLNADCDVSVPCNYFETDIHVIALSLFLNTGHCHSYFRCVYEAQYQYLLSEVRSSKQTEKDTLFFVLSILSIQAATDTIMTTLLTNKNNREQYRTHHRALSILKAEKRYNIFVRGVHIAYICFMLGKVKDASKILNSVIQRYDWCSNKHELKVSNVIPSGPIFTKPFSRNNEKTVEKMVETDVGFIYDFLQQMKNALTFECFRTRKGDCTVWVDPLIAWGYLSFLCGEELEGQGNFRNLVMIARLPRVHNRHICLNIFGHCSLKRNAILTSFKCLRKSMELSTRSLKANAAVWHLARLFLKSGNFTRHAQSQSSRDLAA